MFVIGIELMNMRNRKSIVIPFTFVMMSGVLLLISGSVVCMLAGMPFMAIVCVMVWIDRS